MPLSVVSNAPVSSRTSATRTPQVGDRIEPRYIVGIGASAGGLEAIRALFGALRVVPSMTFVVVQHLAPLHRSRLVELIGHATTLPVREVQDGVQLESGIVYITPPNKDVFLDGRRLRLREPQLKVGPKPSIDLFFKSLAESAGEAAVGIVLSGTGSDGAHGIRAIKAAGGITIAQKIESAKYDGMPRAAKHTGAVDLQLTPEDIAVELARFEQLEPQELNRRVERLPRSEPYQEILSTVERATGACFADYKQTTVRRRIQRRMLATRCESLYDYAAYLERNPDEAKLIFEDILISVTSFFRDRPAFKVLSQHVRERLTGKVPGSVFRCWVVGCATGEEAYTVAIILNEALVKLKKNVDLQIFATDLDERALTLARKAIYSKASFGEIPKNLHEKYFLNTGDYFQIKSIIRDAVVFARHNIGDDPPFLNIDLLSCRNVLIYFNPKLQERVFKVLHYALDKGGLLFLGKSEAAPTDCFHLIDKQAKIYRRLDRKGEVPRPFSRFEANREFELISKEQVGNGGLETFRSLVASMMPDAVLIDDGFKIKHIFGDAGSYLRFAAGEATQTVSKIVPHERGLELSALLHRAQKTGRMTSGRRHEIKLGKERRTIQQTVVPLMSNGARQYLVGFQRLTVEGEKGRKSRTVKGASVERIRKLEQELAGTRDHLQTVIEEQETSNEELQALNEELQSANEELQSSNEELETANEELQSANEELTTVNQELNVKTNELQLLNQRLHAIQAAIVYPLIIVDRNRHLVNFNPAARLLLRFNNSDIGSHLKLVPSRIDLHEVIDAIETALTKGSEPRFQFGDGDRSFEVQVQLFRDQSDAIEGAIVSFVENTQIVSALAESRLNRDRLSRILEGTPAIVTMKDLSGAYAYANRRFSEITGLSTADVVGKTDEDIFGVEQGAELRRHDFEVIAKKMPQEFVEPLEFSGTTRILQSSKFPLLDVKQRVQSVCTVSLDRTERFVHERQLELFQRAMAAASNGVLILEETRIGTFVVRFASERLRESTGVSAEALSGLTLAEAMDKLVPREKAARLTELVDSLQKQATLNITLDVTRPGHEDTWLELRSTLTELGQTTQRHLILNVFDVTQHVRDQRMIAMQQEELTKFNRFSALGEIAAGIAHEINTPLNVITTKTDLLRKLTEKRRLTDESVLQVAEGIDQTIKSISSIVHGVKTVAVRDVDDFENASLNQIVADAMKICEFRLQRVGIDLQLDLPAHEVMLECNRVQIIQILINLINNSVDALATRSDPWIRVDVRDGEHTVEISVTDSGDGIETALAEKIMTPFFTTKKDKKGTGIGLSLSRSIARHHGGDLFIDAGRKNTCFRVVLAKTKRV